MAEWVAVCMSGLGLGFILRIVVEGVASIWAFFFEAGRSV